MKRWSFLIFAVSILTAGCVKDNPWQPAGGGDTDIEVTPGGGTDPGSGDNHDTDPVVMAGPTGENTVIDTGIAGMSGLCMSRDGTFIWGISDSKGLYKFDLDGKQIERVFKGGQDFEGVAVDMRNGDVYLIEETADGVNSNSIWKLNTTVNKPEKVADIAAGSVVNKGLEGITVCGDEIWVANQQSPTDIYRYNISSGKVVGTVTITVAKYLSDIFYDAAGDMFWCTDSKNAQIFTFDKTGKRLSAWSIPSDITKSEGIAVDRKNGYVYLCSDDTGDILKMKFKF